MQEEPMATVLAPLPTSPDGVTADATGQAGALSDWYATADGPGGPQPARQAGVGAAAATSTRPRTPPGRPVSGPSACTS